MMIANFLVGAAAGAFLLVEMAYAQGPAEQGSPSQASSDQRSLFTEVPQGAELSEEVTEALRQIQTRPTSTVEVQLFETRNYAATSSLLSAVGEGAEGFADSRPINIPLPAGRTLEVEGTAAQQLTPNTRSWMGRVVSDSSSGEQSVGTVVITLQGDSVSGTVNLPDAVYDISPIGDDFVAVIRVDQGRARPDEPPPSLRYERRGALEPNNDIQVVRVMVAYTPEARRVSEQQSTTLEQFVAQRFAELNAANLNSDVPLKYEMTSAFVVEYDEAGNWATDRDRFFNDADGHMDSVFEKRHSEEADVVVLLFSSDGYCGEVKDIHASSEDAFAVVDVDPGCTVKYTFAHELGHIGGAEHDLNNASVPPYRAYGHGYIHGNEWRTMMAYMSACSPCHRQLYWSSPLVRYPGANGDPMGTADLQDNARVLKEEASYLSSLYRAERLDLGKQNQRGSMSDSRN